MMSTQYKPNLRRRYEEEVAPKLMKEFGYKSPMQVPRITKIVLNRGVGAAVNDKKLLDASVEELTLIAGQKAVPTYARRSIAGFKLREGMPIGVRVTLRGNRMYEFLERLIRTALPRVRDFRGVSRKLDGRGNYTLGIAEQIVFPEIDVDKVDKIMGLDITIVTTARTDEEGHRLLQEMGMPFQRDEE